MDILAMLIIAGTSAFAIIWLINYVPLIAKFRDRQYSPRLLVCKLLAPFDATITFFLVCGSWLGLTSGVMGIGLMTYNVLTGVGISAGVVIMKKFIIPRWQLQYEHETNK